MTNPLIPSSLLLPLYSSAAMRAIVADEARLQRMLDVESALARAEAALGVIPAAAADPIAGGCKASLYDFGQIGHDAVSAGNLAIPLVKALTAEVGKRDKDASGYVHWGATSQDIIDTALVLDLRAATDALLADIDQAIEGLASLTGRHRRTDTVARTWLQHALPMPFGLKLAGYAAALGRARDRIKRAAKEALVLQFGGAAGTLAALGEQGPDVAERLGKLLDLPLPDAPWHSHRDRLAELASALGILATTCGKIARDVSLLMQTEVGEAFEPAGAGRGGSSTMPHKRNPVAAASALSCAAMAPQLVAIILAGEVQEHERALGGWQSEWPMFPALLLVTSGALAGTVDIAQGLEVDGDRMRANLDITNGLIMSEAVSFALAKKLGKHEAHKLLEEAGLRAVKEKRHLHEVLKDDAKVTSILQRGELARLFEPSTYHGSAQVFIDRLMASAQPRGRNR